MTVKEIEDKWYALFVVTGDEDNVKARLEYRLSLSNIKIVVPKRRLRERKGGIWSYRLRPLFPGYVLIHGNLGYYEYYCLKNIPGIIRLLRDSYDPIEIDGKEILLLKRLIRENGIIEQSNIALEDDKVTVIDGPLLGMEGLIESIDRRKGRVKVRVDFIGEARLVELSVSLLQVL